MSNIGMLGDNKVLRRLWSGPLFDLACKLNSERGPEFEEELNKFLREETCWVKAAPTAVPAPEPKPLPKPITINADLDPNIPSGLFLAGEGAEHRKMGQITLEKREDGKLYINGVEATLFLSPEQIGKTIQGYKLREELADRKVLNACVFDALRANPHLIPDDWKQDEQGRTRYIFFWGTVFRSAGGGLCVESLCWGGGRWNWVYGWLGSGWGVLCPAALLAG